MDLADDIRRRSYEFEDEIELFQFFGRGNKGFRAWEPTGIDVAPTIVLSRERYLDTYLTCFDDCRVPHVVVRLSLDGSQRVLAFARLSGAHGACVSSWCKRLPNRIAALTHLSLLS